MDMTESDHDKELQNLEGLVHHQARSLWNVTNRIVPLDDLIHYGHVGLLEARKRFNPKRGVQFTTFAYYRIRGAILDGLRQMSGLSRSYMKRVRVQRQLVDCLEQMLSMPLDQGSAETIWHQLQRILADLQSSYLIAMTADWMVSDDDPTEYEAVELLMIERVRAVLEELPSKERALIERVYYRDESLAEAARELGMSRSWACRMHRRILHWLRQRLAASSLVSDGEREASSLKIR